MHRVSVVLQDWMTGTEQDWSSPVEEDDVEEDDVEMTGEDSGKVSRVDEDPFEKEMLCEPKGVRSTGGVDERKTDSLQF